MRCRNLCEERKLCRIVSTAIVLWIRWDFMGSKGRS